MDFLLVATYVAICVVIFKTFNIPLTKWTVPTAFLGGVLLIGALMVLMNYNHPYSAQSRLYFYTTPINPGVAGRVISVDAKANTALKAGDVIFKVDPEPYQDMVDELTARLIPAKNNLSRAKQMFKKGLGKQLSVDETQGKVDALKAKLEKAKFDLEQTIVIAPTDGYVTQLLLRTGVYVVPLPLRPVVVFVNDSSYQYVAWFRQNSLSRLAKGDLAEIAFDGLPGQVFIGEVEGVIPVLAEGQLQASGNLISDQNINQGLVPVKIKITDPKFAQYKALVPGGAYAQTAIYTEHFHHLSIIRKVLLRMSSWMNFVFPLH